jgi:omega-6 fatty acid desaturase (delta-12 desaturase)
MVSAMIETSASNEVNFESRSPDPRAWVKIFARYREPATSRSVFELLVTAVPFVILWTLMWGALGIGYWLCLLLAMPTAGFLMRLFMIQHDCGHGAFLRRRRTNDWVGRIIGVVTLTPYGMWRRSHAIHHAAVGNLDHRGLGDIITLTVDEYLALSPARRLGYRVYRYPAVMFVVMPAYLFLLHHRFPFGLAHAGWQPWLSTMGTNLAIAAVVVAMAWLIGIWSFLLIQGPIVLVAGSIAVWFFYVQHQFEGTQWAHEDDWSVLDAALHGSSHYELPRPLAWFTGNIGVHHVHHLCSRVPFYRLREVLDDHPDIAPIGRLTLAQSLRCATLALWDEQRQRLISFREFNRGRSRSAVAATRRLAIAAE